MGFECIKCKKIFSRNKNLELHINRKYPCDRILKCDKCEKIFKKKIDFERHNNRKYPCKSEVEKITIIDKLLEIEKERTRRVEIRKNSNLEEIKLKNNNKIELENKRLEIFKEKKSMTTTTDRPNITINNPTINMHVTNYNTTNMHIANHILTKNLDTYGNLLGDDLSIKNNIITILRLIYNDSNFPKYKNLMFCNDKFFKIRSDNSWIEVEYENIKDMLIHGLKKFIIPTIQKYKLVSNPQDPDDYNSIMQFKLQGCNSLLNCNKKSSEKTMLGYVEKALDPDNDIKKVNTAIEDFGFSDSDAD